MSRSPRYYVGNPSDSDQTLGCAQRELLLIDGLLTSGMGSWADAAEHIGTRTREEVEAHYNEVYVNSEDWPMPVGANFTVFFAPPADR